MSEMYKTTRRTPLSEAILKMLVDMDYLQKVDSIPDLDPREKERRFRLEAEKVVSPLPEVSLPKPEPGYLRSGASEYLNNHNSIENNIEKMSKEHIGKAEDKKLWLKELKEAVKEYGHDPVLESFYQWSLSQGPSLMSQKPVTLFLKNVGSHVGSVSTTPLATNPALDRTEQRVAYITDNKVFFLGEYRFKLAQLLQAFGEELVLQAFEDFYQDVPDKSIPWAARDFLQRASVMITIIQKKNIEANLQQQVLAKSIQEAQRAATEEIQEEENEL